jgi:hypothetical protein
MFQEPVPDNQPDDKLAEAIALLNSEAQAILFGSFAVLAFQIFSQYVAVALQRTGSSRYVHIGSITLMALTILWSAPVAFPSEARWAQRCEYLYRIFKRELTIARVLLVMGIAAEIYVVTRVEMHSYVISLASAAAMLVAGCGLWFVVPLFKRWKSSD